MKTLTVHLFRESFGGFVGLLNEHGVKYEMRATRSGVQMASSGALEVFQAIGNAAMWGALAAVIVAYINSRRGRKVIVTTKDGTVIHAEGLSVSELEAVLNKAQSLTAFDPGKPVAGESSSATKQGD